jgi:uncharacterized membrane protein
MNGAITETLTGAITGNETLAAIAVMTLAAALCRLSGFWFMGLIPVTRRVEAGLGAIPLAVMIGIMVPAVIKGGMPEALGLIAVFAAVKLKTNDLVATLSGLATVALVRQIV